MINFMTNQVTGVDNGDVKLRSLHGFPEEKSSISYSAGGTRVCLCHATTEAGGLPDRNRSQTICHFEQTRKLHSVVQILPMTTMYLNFPSLLDLMLSGLPIPSSSCIWLLFQPQLLLTSNLSGALSKMLRRRPALLGE